MGKHFGELAHLRGIITYKLSPFEQRAFAGAITKGLPNIFMRIGGNLLRILPPFLIGYGTYRFVEHLHDQTLRKNPADYENDE